METDPKQIIKFSIFALCTLLTMSAVNILPYNPITIYLAFGLLAGPISAIIFYKQKYWMRALVAVLVFTGLSGLAYLGNSFGRSFLYQEELQYSSTAYLLHGIFSVLFIAIFVTWYYMVGRKENKNGI
jgi:hypothetical protein